MSDLNKALAEAASGVIAEADYDMWKWYKYGEGEEPEGFTGLGELIRDSLERSGFKVISNE